MKNESLSRENRELVDKMIDGRLTPEEFDVLEERLYSDPAVAELYVDGVLLHSELSLAWNDSAGSAMLGQDRQFLSPGLLEGRKKSPDRLLFAAAGLLALFLSACLVVLFFRNGPVETTFATMTATKGCLWENSTALTPPGSRLGPSTLNLKVGISRIDFDCGAVVRIEGPCRFELVASKECVLHGGKAVIEAASDEAKGFVMVTPSTIIKDVGTAFHVHVGEDAATEVTVLEGRVDVRSRTTGETAVLLKDDVRLFSFENVREPATKHKTSPDAGDAMLQLPTTFGRGREASVIYGADQLDPATGKPLVRSFEYMQVKTSIPGDSKSNRKAFFRFDLESPQSERFFERKGGSVSLRLAYGPTGLGFAAFVPDATFVVYGFKGGTDDFWSENELSWNSIPGNGLRNEMDESLWEPLGRFTIPQGDTTGSIHLETEELTRFVGKREPGGTISFALVRETEAEQISGMVHGFANRLHPELSPPRLIFCCDAE